MIEFILYLFIGCLWCYGVYAVFDSKHLLGPLADWLENKLGEKVVRPVFGCPPCMASVHGIVIGLYAFDCLWVIIPFVICLCGLNFIIKNIIFESYDVVEEYFPKKESKTDL